MSKYQVKRPRHLGEVKRLDEQARVADLPAAAAAHEAPKLLLIGPSLPRRLLLEGAERSKLSLSVNDPFHRGGTKSADQLVLQVCDADIETQPFEIGACEVGAEAGSLETMLEVALLCGVAETRQLEVEPRRPELGDEASDCLRTPDRHDRNALGLQIATTPLSQGLDRELVARPFNEHHGTQVNARGQRVRCVTNGTAATATPFDVCQVNSLLLVHLGYLRAERGPFGPIRILRGFDSRGLHFVVVSTTCYDPAVVQARALSPRRVSTPLNERPPGRCKLRRLGAKRP